MKTITAMSSDAIERFWSKVDKNRSSIFYSRTRCWEWAIGTFSDGYGQFWLNGTNHRAHRVSWAIAHSDAGNLKVCHHCDNPLCVNPNHLFLGTSVDNAKDMCIKGRDARGEKAGLAKLTWKQVEEIRQRYAKGDVWFSDLAAEYGVHYQQIARVVRFQTWRQP